MKSLQWISMKNEPIISPEQGEKMASVAVAKAVQWVDPLATHQEKAAVLEQEAAPQQNTFREDVEAITASDHVVSLGHRLYLASNEGGKAEALAELVAQGIKFPVMMAPSSPMDLFNKFSLLVVSEVRPEGSVIPTHAVTFDCGKATALFIKELVRIVLAREDRKEALADIRALVTERAEEWYPFIGDPSEFARTELELLDEEITTPISCYLGDRKISWLAEEDRYQVIRKMIGHNYAHLCVDLGEEHKTVHPRTGALPATAKMVQFRAVLVKRDLKVGYLNRSNLGVYFLTQEEYLSYVAMMKQVVRINTVVGIAESTYGLAEQPFCQGMVVCDHATPIGELFPPLRRFLPSLAELGSQAH